MRGPTFLRKDIGENDWDKSKNEPKTNLVVELVKYSFLKLPIENIVDKIKHEICSPKFRDVRMTLFL